MRKQVIVNDRMQSNYFYYLTAQPGCCFAPEFTPDLTPKEMLKLGVFGGKYMTDCKGEFPADWFRDAKLCAEIHNPECNFFGVNASQSLAVWQERGWLYEEDPRGWFQGYCRYYMGGRCADDERHIKRWKAFRRHASQVLKNCKKGDLRCRPKQRQALLNWAYDSRNY